MIKDRGFYLFDIEQFGEFHCSVWYNIDTGQKFIFVIHKLRDDRKAYRKFLETVKKGIGFNVVNYDYPVIHCLMDNMNKELTVLLRTLTKLSLNIINNDEYSSYIKYKRFELVDLFKIWHYDNAARRTSLKALQFSMNYPNVEEFDFRVPVKTMADVETVVSYCENDVDSTRWFYEKSLDKIRLRQQLRKQFKGFDCINYSDSLLGEKLVLYFYEKETGITEQELRHKKSKYLYPTTIKNKDILFDYLDFKRDDMNVLFNCFKESTLSTYPKLRLNPSAFENKQRSAIYVEYEGKKNEKYKIYQVIDDLEYYFGAGGLHASRQGSFYSDNEYILIDADVTSLYPRLADVNGLFPVLLGSEFCKIYRNKIIEVRVASKNAITAHKKGIKLLKVDEVTYHKLVSDGYKLAANSVYGKSNDDNSVLKDPVYTSKTTINGQLSIYMLCEMFLPLGKIIQANTDGVTLLLKRDKLAEYHKICDEWQKLTNLELEFDEFKAFHMRDVNNYLVIKNDGSTKEKGAYEVDKVNGNERAYHKNNSFRIVPLAVREYFVNGLDPLEVILGHRNIYDFLGREKFQSDSYGQLRNYDDTDDDDGDLFGQKLYRQETPKVTRYYVTKKGKALHKVMKKTNRSSRVNVGYQINLCQKVEDENAKHYDINYDFYLNEALKLINNI